MAILEDIINSINVLQRHQNLFNLVWPLFTNIDK